MFGGKIRTSTRVRGGKMDFTLYFLEIVSLYFGGLFVKKTDMLISHATRGATAEVRPLTWKQVNKAVPVPCLTRHPTCSASDSHLFCSNRLSCVEATTPVRPRDTHADTLDICTPRRASNPRSGTATSTTQARARTPICLPRPRSIIGEEETRVQHPIT